MKSTLSIATIVFMAAACGMEKDVEFEQNAIQMMDAMRPYLKKNDLIGGAFAFSSNFFHFAFASFAENPGKHCDAVEQIGACQVNVNCARSPASPRLSAGPVTMTGGLRPVTLNPNPAEPDGYDFIFDFGRLWNGGEEIAFSAPGELGQVPPFEFSGKGPFEGTLTAPEAFLSPEWTLENPLTINRAEPLDFAWNFGAGVVSPSQVVVLIAFFTDSRAPTQTNVICEFDSRAGAGTIPAAALSRLPAGPAFGGPQAELHKPTFAQLDGKGGLGIQLLTALDTPTGFSVGPVILE